MQREKRKGAGEKKKGQNRAYLDPRLGHWGAGGGARGGSGMQGEPVGGGNCQGFLYSSTLAEPVCVGRNTPHQRNKHKKKGKRARERGGWGVGGGGQ